MPSPWDNEFPASFDVGSPSAGHVHFDEHGQKFYGPDGVTVLFELNNDTGDVTITGGLTAESLSTGPGNPHVVIDSTGAEFTDAFGNVLLSWNPATGALSLTDGTIIGGTIETSTGGTRLVLNGAANELEGYYLGALKGVVKAAVNGLLVASADGNSYLQTINGAAALESNGTVVVSAPTTLLGQAGNNNTTIESNSLFDVAGHPYPKWGGSNQRTINAATKSGTTDANGRITTNHSLPGTPIAVTASLDTSASFFGFVVSIFNITSTQITFQVWTNSTTPTASASVDIYWIAIG